MKQMEMNNRQELTMGELETVCAGIVSPVVIDFSWVWEEDEKDGGASGGW